MRVRSSGKFDWFYYLWSKMLAGFLNDWLARSQYWEFAFPSTSYCLLLVNRQTMINYTCLGNIARGSGSLLKILSISR